MKRTLLTHLTKWLNSKNRKPLVIRGARQVGKTWLVRHFAQNSKKKIIELNFEKHPSHASFFNSNDPKQILLNLSALTNQEINLDQSILFLDEIQAVPQLFGKLRWFAEDLPQLPVIAAGSLLEFLLMEHAFSMPVGRISYLYLEPLSFEEFLLAKNKNALLNFIENYNFNIQIPLAIHEQFTTLFKEYVLVGGMPAVVSNWTTDFSLDSVNQTQHDLLATYRNDFGKYKGNIILEKLDAVMMSIPKMLGQKFVFSRVDTAMQATIIKRILTLLENARICYRVKSSAANGVPLAAEIKEKYFKEIFLDVGLCCAALGLSFNTINSALEINMINSGGIAEQITGQLLRMIEPPYIEPALYCWHREESGSSAEIDYIIQHNNQVIPIEVKAGSTGTLKSLHLFMGLKQLPTAIRVNSDFPSKTEIQVKNSLSQEVKYTLLSIPFYLIGQIHRLLTDLNIVANNI